MKNGYTEAEQIDLYIVLNAVNGIKPLNVSKAYYQMHCAMVDSI